MMRAGLATIVVVLAVAAGGCYRPGTHYALGYGVSNGAGMLPPTASRGTTTTLTYHEHSGVLVRAIAMAGAAMSVVDNSKVTSVEYRGDYVIEHREISAEDAAEFENVTMPGILNEDLPMEIDIGVASTGLGGDTTGGHVLIMYPIPLTWRTVILFGAAYAGYTFHDRTIRDVVPSMGGLSSMERTDDLDYEMAGARLELLHAVTARYRAFFRWDLNAFGPIEGQASPITLGASLVSRFAQLKAMVTFDRIEPGAATLGLEVWVGI